MPKRKVARIARAAEGAPGGIAALLCVPASGLSSCGTGGDFVREGGLLTGQIAAWEE